MTGPFDIAIVGAGILGLAHAYHLGKAGKKVLVLERHAKAQGASVRNFGMVWPIGQPAGDRFALAARSREIWLEVLSAAGIWHERSGSLHLAYADDEAAVLREFANDPRHAGRGYEILSADQVAEKSPWIRKKDLRAGLLSPIETTVDPRQVVAELPGYLSRAFGVQFEFNAAALGYDGSTIRTSRGNFLAKKLLVCSGDELQVLYPEALAAAGLFKCKLQMMRTSAYPAGQRLGPMLAAGLTLMHYTSFAECPALAGLRARMHVELPDYVRYGIHVLASQTGKGEVTLGDSHEYGDEIDIFSKEKIDDLVLAYLNRFLDLPNAKIAERWQGIYLKHPKDPWFISRPAENVTLVTGVGGAGMTLSFGLAEKVVRNAEG